MFLIFTKPMNISQMKLFKLAHLSMLRNYALNYTLEVPIWN